MCVYVHDILSQYIDASTETQSRKGNFFDFLYNPPHVKRRTVQATYLIRALESLSWLVRWFADRKDAQKMG